MNCVKHMPHLRQIAAESPDRFAALKQAHIDIGDPLTDDELDHMRIEYQRWRDSRRMSHRHDPDTSRQAARRAVASGSVDDHVRRVVAAVRTRPGMTSAELAQHAGLERHEAARRLPDAEKRGLVRKGPARKCSLSGRAAVTWHVALTQSQQRCLRGGA